ncbi:hypothetical protein H9L12_03590 [Sphingomonas rhizophila]|uniref:Uncharacterized protein n=1 Tax=Sphingomonas rhizophila TaxID=2071607 RepID=A0A7G9SCT7_9SPHN|nr:hypothetical protein [Sphingomonas rhizophila]QNN65662.1 hypothetical protein H9L12_03590 [Sphingomonas rhizophila]
MWGVVGALALMGLFFATMPIARARHARLAKKRGRTTSESFDALMLRAGVSGTTSRYLWKNLQAYYHEPLTPHPDDRLESVIAIDRPEIEGLVSHFWSTMRGHDAFPTRSPLRDDPTVAELGRYFDSLTGWTVLRAA